MCKEKAEGEYECCLDADMGLTQWVSYIGAAGCFCFSFLGFAMNYLIPNPHAVVFGIVALGLGVLMLVVNSKGEK